MPLDRDLDFSTEFGGTWLSMDGEATDVVDAAVVADATPDVHGSGADGLLATKSDAREGSEKGEGLGLPAPSSPDMADTVPGDTSSVATITIGTTVDVNIETPGDHDWYRVTLTGGVTYTIQSYQQSPASNPDSYLGVRDALGNVIIEDDDAGNGTFSLIAFRPTTTGTFYIDATTYSGQGQSSSGVYHLGVAAVLTGADSVGGTVGSASSIAIGGTLDGKIDTAGDHDVYAVQLVAGQTYMFRTEATQTITTTDTILTLRDAGGAQILTNDDAGEASFSAIRYTATASGTYYLDVSAFNTGTGEFNLVAFTTDTPVLYTNDQIALQLTNGYWGGESRHWAVSPGGSLTFNVQALTGAGQTLARAALAVWTEVSGITFQEVASGGQIVYDDNQDGAFASSTVGGGIISASTVNVSTAWLTSYGTGINTYSFQTYLHETGHALGLGHAGNYNGNADYGSDSLYLNDAWATTVMSYFDQTENTYFQGMGFTREFIVSPMVADGIAIANLYGVNTLTRTGDTTYGFNSNAGEQIYLATNFATVPSYTIYDNGGTDTLDYSGYSQNQTINLNAETFSNIGTRIGNVSIARGAVIENAIGGTGNDTIIGNDANNLINLRFGGNDSVSGGAGNDGFYFGAAFTAADTVDGGAGALDQIALQGNYAGGVTLAAASIANVEQVVLLTGADISFGDTAGNRYSYNLTLNDANVAAGQILSFSANTLLVTENFTLNASAETNGQIVTYGGAGIDTITGGQQSDGFFFGVGLWGASDSVNGQGGSFDQLAIQGNYTGGAAITFGASQIVSIESLVLLSASDQRFGNGGASYSYAITMNDANVTGGSFAISANTLTATETLTLNASAESSAAITVFSGAGNDVIGMGAGSDRVFGGAGSDLITGRGGADDLTGGTGNDTFAYLLLSDSAAGARDHIFDFTGGERIDLGALDGNSVVGGAQAFTFVGTAALTGAGQLHAVSAGGNDWLIEGDTDGNGAVDFAILVTSDHQITGADFSSLGGQAAVAPETVDLFATVVPGDAAPIDFASHQLFTHDMLVPTPQFV